MSDVSLAAIEAARVRVIAFVNQQFDDLVKATAPPKALKVVPTAEQAADPRNKNGRNLTDRGAEILYRLFDDGAGYNRASKALNISQMAAKNRKNLWRLAGGLNRPRLTLDID